MMNLPIACMYFWFPKLLVTIFGLGAKIEQGKKKTTTPPTPRKKKPRPIMSAC
jgi:hypothetical protein